MNALALEAVLDELATEAPAAVERGRAALARALAWTATTSWGEIAWSFSDLAGGAPVELVWRPGRPGLFWTAEPAPPEWPTPRRLDRALALARTLGARFKGTEISLLRTLLAASKAPWPIWLSGRHYGACDVAKLYALTGPATLSLAPGAALLRGDDKLVMLGLSADGGREVYWRRPSPQPGDRWRMARVSSLEPLAARLDAALVDWTRQGLSGEGLGRIGFSLKLSPAGEPEALAAFLRVRQVGTDKVVRARLMAAGGDSNPALGKLWAAGQLRPMFLTIAAMEEGIELAIGLRVVIDK